MEKPAADAAVIDKMMNRNILTLLLCVGILFQGIAQDSTSTYKKRVLETTEVDFLMSYYTQEGSNAAVSGGLGTEELTDIAPTIIVSMPLNDDDVLTVDFGISAYTSASSSNINPLDSNGPADPFVASSGASSGDVWGNLTGSYTHSSDDRNDIWSAKVSVSTEYDYFSFGFGGSYSKLFNERNTELSLNANVFIDSWSLIYPIELRGIDLSNYSVSGNVNYNPAFVPLDSKGRNSYSLGFGFSQILSKRMQGSIAVDLVQQQGQLSTPFQRVYFSDFEDTFIDNFHLADDIERLPDTRLKVAIGGRLNYYINELFVIRTQYRYYFDDWGINSHTASIEVPVKVSDKFTVYPSYRFYNQTAADYFAPYNQHLSTSEFYTSDYDLSEFTANQFGFGITYTDIFTKFRIWRFGLKSIDLKFDQYERDSGLKYSLISGGFNFVMD